ncbi:hypothetical protein WK28_05695 [Burkholderia vietnamiensis]|nr:hypothetical protein WK28_05695 [Burkholderia vietnamiensis]
MTVQQQMEFVMADADPGRLAKRYFPCNREDALLLLGGLAVSAWVPDAAVRLAMQPEGVALIGDGLRASEAALLEGGEPERFPLLVELAPAREIAESRIIGFADIRQLVFRSQDEADAFRFRAVDEFDPAALACVTEPARFGLPGEARFSLREAPCAHDADAGRIADRLAAGLGFAFAIASQRPACRPALTEFLQGADDAWTGESLDFQSSCIALTGIDAEQLTGRQRAIVGSFAGAGNASRGELLDALMLAFAAAGAQDGEARAIEGSWETLTRKVIRGEVVLDGDRLGDDKSVLLRGTLLSLIAETPQALCAFLDAEKPAGPKVTVLAAFLAGLKTGLAAMPWAIKAPQAAGLGALSAAIVRAVASDSGTIVRLAHVIHETIVHGASTANVADGVPQLGAWQEQLSSTPDSVEAYWQQQLERFGYRIVDRGSVPLSWRVQFPHGHVVRIAVREAAGRQFPELTYRLAANAKPKKAAELAAFFAGGTRLWYPRKDEAGDMHFACELPALPDRDAVDVLADVLDHVIGQCVTERKVTAVRRKSPPRT